MSSAEAEVLHAVIEGNQEKARHLLKEFLPGELVQLEDAMYMVEELIEERLAEIKDEQT
jgi:hypothetical protein